MKKWYFLVAALALLGIGLYVLSLFSAIGMDNPRLQISTGKIRILTQKLVEFSDDHRKGQVFPATVEWPTLLLETGYITEDMLVSPVQGSDSTSYIYVEGMNKFDPKQILIYEDPEHWPKKGVLVGFTDLHVEFVPLDEFEEMLKEQRRKMPLKMPTEAEIREGYTRQSSTYIRSLVIAVQGYARNSNGGLLPTQEQWSAMWGWEIEEDLFVSPVEDGDGLSFIYVRGPNTLDATQILVYEDPKHWPNRGVLVGFADNHTAFIPFNEFDRMLATQTQQPDVP